MGESRTNLSHALETGKKYPTHEKIIMGVDSHLDLIGSEMLDEVDHSGIAVKALYHKLLWEPVGRDLRKWRIRDSQDGKSSPPRGCGFSSLICFLTISMRSSMRGVFVGL